MAREMDRSNCIARAHMRATAFKRSRPDAEFGHGLIRKSLCDVTKPKHQRSTAWARSLAPSIGALISALITVLSTVFRKENTEGSRRHIIRSFCSPGPLKDPLCASRAGQ
jgi:hypothetical protein